MNKLIYITETQLNEIVGNGAYLNTNDTTNEYRFGGSEISSNGVTGSYTDGDNKIGKPVTTDKIANQIRNQHRFGGYCNYVRKSILPESNQDLTGKQNTFQISKNTLDDIRERINNFNGDKNSPGFKRALQLLKTGRISYDNAYRTLNDYKNGIGNDILGFKLENELKNKINTGENISKNNREAKMNRGENVLKSTNKTGMKGGAHTPKGNNTIGITYEN